MKKHKHHRYLKRWNKLTEDQKVLFFTTYMMVSKMCDRCINPKGKIKECSQCEIMFPSLSNSAWGTCPCYEYRNGHTEDHPPAAIEYCLINDGWIEKE